jgi:tRNA1Val (adenine37-N6)-methyltransferase
VELIREPDEISPRGGLIRGTRRPPGWTPGGPAPHPPEDRSALWPEVGEDLCMLAGDWRLLQRTDGHRFSLDDIVTAWFAASTAAPFQSSANASREGRLCRPELIAGGAEPSQGSAFDAILDMGCGIGTVLLLMAWRFPEARVVGIEAQALSAGLARRSLAWNGIQDRSVVLSGDLRDPLPPNPWNLERFDLITGTPPYFPRGTGVESEHVQRGPCRFEHRGGIEAYAAAAAARLAPGAPFVACAAATQAERVRAGAAAAGLYIDRWRDVVPRAGKAPLLSVFSMRATEPGNAATAPSTVVESPLIVRHADGRRTDEFVAVRTAMGMPG